MATKPKKQTTSASAAALGLSTSVLAKATPKPPVKKTTPKPVVKTTPKPASTAFDAPPVTSVAVGGSTVVFPGDFGDGGVPGGTAILDTVSWTKAGTVQTLNGPVDVDSTGKAKDGSTPVAAVPTSELNTGPTKTQVDSVAAIKSLLASYGIGDLGDAITNAVVKGYSTDTIQLIMQDPNSNDPLAVAFQVRFPANKARAAAGKSVLSPAEYLRAERSYTEVLKSYGVSNLASKEKLSQFISNDVSATEVADRVGIAINRVQNADPDTKKALAEYYPMLNQADIVNAVLSPDEGLPALQRKIQIAEIGGAALAQGIKTSEGKTNIMMGASALADLGVTQATARKGFEQVAEVTPRGEFLSQISPGENYGQLQAEQEAFQGLASAKRARVSLTEQERARFGGASGVNKASLASQTRGAI